MQSAQAIPWVKSLRSRSPSPGGRQKRQESGTPKATGTSNSLSDTRLSRTDVFSAGAGGAKRYDLTGHSLAEATGSYIAALQQQVYFLELEAAHLREEARQATALHPRMTAEAQQMLNELRGLEGCADDLELQLMHLDADVAQATAARNAASVKLESEVSLRVKERHLLADEVVLARKERDDAAVDGVHKDSQLNEAEDANEKLRLSISLVEGKNKDLSAQLDQKTEEHCMTKIALEEKVAHLSLVATHLSEMELRYLDNTAVARDKAVAKLKAEVQLLRRALDISTASIVTTPVSLTRNGCRAITLAEENTLLKERTAELSTRLQMQRNLRNAASQQLEADTAEVLRLYSITKALELEVKQPSTSIHCSQQLDDEVYSDDPLAILDNKGAGQHYVMGKAALGNRRPTVTGTAMRPTPPSMDGLGISSHSIRPNGVRDIHHHKYLGIDEKGRPDPTMEDSRERDLVRPPSRGVQHPASQPVLNHGDRNVGAVNDSATVAKNSDDANNVVAEDADAKVTPKDEQEDGRRNRSTSQQAVSREETAVLDDRLKGRQQLLPAGDTIPGPETDPLIAKDRKEAHEQAEGSTELTAVQASGAQVNLTTSQHEPKPSVTAAGTNGTEYGESPTLTTHPPSHGAGTAALQGHQEVLTNGPATSERGNTTGSAALKKSVNSKQSNVMDTANLGQEKDTDATAHKQGSRTSTAAREHSSPAMAADLANQGQASRKRSLSEDLELLRQQRMHSRQGESTPSVQFSDNLTTME